MHFQSSVKRISKHCSQNNSALKRSANSRSKLSGLFWVLWKTTSAVGTAKRFYWLGAAFPWRTHVRANPLGFPSEILKIDCISNG
eukprot:735216-Amorphochlora_amoeboformis.AAC.2